MRSKHFLIVMLTVLTVFFSMGAGPSSDEDIIINGDVYYFKSTLIAKLKTSGKDAVGITEVVSKVNSSSGEFRFTTAEPLFPVRSVERAGNLDNIIVLKYDSESDPNYVASKIKGLGMFEWVEPRYLYQLSFDPNDPSYASQWNLQKISAPAAWNITQGDTNIVIGIVDTGVDWDHPDLNANIWVNRNEIPNNGIDDDNNGFIDDVIGWDFGGLSGTPDNNPMEDRPDHGTHVAGISSAVTNNGIGVAAIGFNSKIMAVKTSQDDIRNPQGLALIAYGYEGITYAAENGAQVINCSWGGSNYSILAQEVLNYATSLGSLIIAAAGNTGNSNSHYPSGYANVLSVASTTQNDTKSGFSTFGTTVDISAPGSSIFATWQNDTYATLSGTSMAAPLVAGAAALVFHQFPNYTPLQVGEQLRVNSDNIDNLNPSFQYMIGKGRLNAAASLTNTNSVSVRATDFIFSDEAPGGNGDGIFQSGETITLEVKFMNYLSPTSNLSIQLESRNSYSTIQNGIYNAGAVGTLQMFDNSSNKFSFTLGTMPANARLQFLLKYTDGNYSDYQWTEITGNPSYGTQSGNDVSVTITSKGTMAFNDYPNNLQGDGFRYDSGPNLLFEGALILATSSTKVSDAARGANQSFQNNDFTVIQPFTISIPGQIADMEGNSVFSDDNAGGNKIGITSRLTSYSFSDAGNNNYIIVRYNLKNTSGAEITNLHAGLFFDWDLIDGSGAGDVTQWDDTGKLGQVYNTTGGPSTRVGTALISSDNYGFWAIKNDGGDGGFQIYDGFDDGEKWQALSNGIGKPNAGPGDISHVISGGPYNIPVNDSIDVAFVISAASSIEDLRTAVANARTRFNGILTSAGDSGQSMPLVFELNQNYPNPFNPTTVISWQSPVRAIQVLKVYDVLGKEVATLVNEERPAGNYEVKFDASRLTSGIYFYRISAGSYVSTRKMILLK